MPNVLAIILIIAAVLITALGYPAYGIIPLGVLIAYNGQKWKKD